jgi:hypothetical protein
VSGGYPDLAGYQVAALSAGKMIVSGLIGGISYEVQAKQ